MRRVSHARGLGQAAALVSRPARSCCPLARGEGQEPFTAAHDRLGICRKNRHRRRFVAFSSDVDFPLVTGFENDMNATRFVVHCFAIALTACAATGPRYPEHVAMSADIPPHTTRLTVFRTAESTQYSGRSATVKIDGRERGGCDFAGYQSFFVPAGPRTLAVEMWDAPGKCSLSIDVLGGEEYFYEVFPRAESSIASFLGVLISLFAPARTSGIAPFAIMGAESAGKACGGAFSVIGVDEDLARRKLKDLRMSR